ncbi:hypothetical protein Taro_038827 [Colocasia esculenta]|uniref:Uncharacterized protein n=1 Tax=Colocasia esculenta TaxID=4460 RepID=A0A843WEY3_COLES|nr:hypothetical protein [Colocasia esculenta]
MADPLPPSVTLVVEWTGDPWTALFTRVLSRAIEGSTSRIKVESIFFQDSVWLLDSKFYQAERDNENNFVYKVLASRSPDLMNFHEDHVSLEAPSKIQLKPLAEEMQAITKGLEKVELELAASENDVRRNLGGCRAGGGGQDVGDDGFFFF